VVARLNDCEDDGAPWSEAAGARLTIGTWYFHCSTTDFLGRSERVRRGGFSSQVAAREARDACLDASAADRTAEGWTVERWLRYWLDSRLRIRPTTRLHYTRDLELALIPHLGKYRLADLDGPLLRAVFTKIAKIPNRKGSRNPPPPCNTCAARCGPRSTSPSVKG
jgi:hypothetical protein